jgi:hypothetical protein
VVLEVGSETSIAIAYSALSMFVSCLDMVAVSGASAPNPMPLAEEIVSSGPGAFGI